MKKVPSVTHVRVSLKDGLTILDLNEGNGTTLTELRQIIKNNGFVSKEVAATLKGSISTDRKTATVSGTNEQVALAADPIREGDLWRVKVASPAKP